MNVNENSGIKSYPLGTSFLHYHIPCDVTCCFQIFESTPISIAKISKIKSVIYCIQKVSLMKNIFVFEIVYSITGNGLAIWTLYRIINTIHLIIVPFTLFYLLIAYSREISIKHFPGQMSREYRQQFWTMFIVYTRKIKSKTHILHFF